MRNVNPEWYYGWDQEPKEDTVKINCGTCNKVMAEDVDADTAHEIAAYETGSYCDESGEYECESCGDERHAEGMAAARAYDAEQRTRRAREDDEAARESLLAAADLAFDRMREQG